MHNRSPAFVDRNSIDIDPNFGDAFFAEPPSEQEIKLTFALPDKPESMQSFLVNEISDYKTGISAVIKELQTWFSDHDAAFNQASNGIEQLGKFQHQLFSYSGSNAEMNKIAFPLYSDGVRLLYALSLELRNNEVPLPLRYSTLYHLCQTLGDHSICQPAKYSLTAESVSKLKAGRDVHELMKFLIAQAIKTVFIRHKKEYADEMGGNEYHYENAIHNLLSPAFGLKLIDDEYISNCNEHILAVLLDVVIKKLNSELNANSVMNAIISSDHIDLHNVLTLLLSKGGIDAFQEKLNFYGYETPGEEIYSFHKIVELIYDEDDNDVYVLKPDHAEIIALSILTRLTNRGYFKSPQYVHYHVDNILIQFAPKNDLLFSSVKTPDGKINPFLAYCFDLMRSSTQCFAVLSSVHLTKKQLLELLISCQNKLAQQPLDEMQSKLFTRNATLLLAKSKNLVVNDFAEAKAYYQVIANIISEASWRRKLIRQLLGLELAGYSHAIQLCVLANDVEVLKSLLNENQGKPLDELYDDDGYNALALAVKNNHPEAALLMLQSNLFETHYTRIPKNGIKQVFDLCVFALIMFDEDTARQFLPHVKPSLIQRLFSLAIEKGFVTIAKHLLENFPNLPEQIKVANPLDALTETPEDKIDECLDLAIQFDQKHFKVTNGSPRLIERLLRLQKYDALERLLNYYSQRVVDDLYAGTVITNPYHIAIDLNDVRLLSILEKFTNLFKSVRSNYRINDAVTPFGYAIKQNRWNCISIFLDSGNLFPFESKSEVFNYILRHSTLEVIGELVERLKSYKQLRVDSKTLSRLVIDMKFDVILFLLNSDHLQKNSFNQNGIIQGSSLLLHAISEGQVEVCKRLLTIDVAINFMTERGETALVALIQSNLFSQSGKLELLIMMLAKQDLNISPMNAELDPLLLAIEQNDHELLRMLLCHPSVTLTSQQHWFGGYQRPSLLGYAKTKHASTHIFETILQSTKLQLDFSNENEYAICIELAAKSSTSTQLKKCLIAALINTLTTKIANCHSGYYLLFNQNHLREIYVSLKSYLTTLNSGGYIDASSITDLISRTPDENKCEVKQFCALIDCVKPDLKQSSEHIMRR